jgi:hypothetical protein
MAAGGNHGIDHPRLIESAMHVGRLRNHSVDVTVIAECTEPDRRVLGPMLQIVWIFPGFALPAGAAVLP